MNLYSRLYTQRTRKNLKNQTIYLGEDAFPYAKDNLLIVADGLGGRGGYPHQEVNRDILDYDKFFDLTFKLINKPPTVIFIIFLNNWDKNFPFCKFHLLIYLHKC